MRKVFHQDSGGAGLALAVIFSVGFTALLFGFIPFAHRVNKPQGAVELVKTTVVDLPPPREEEAPPPQVEEEKPPEAAPEPQLAETQQQIPLSADLEMATGSGAAIMSFDVRSFTGAETVKDEVFNVTELEKVPEVISQVDPSYPPELRKARIEGKVTILFVLDETGRVGDPRVENSSRPEFEKPALDAVRKWRFRPGMRDGQPVRTYLKVPIGFRVKSG